MTDIVLATGVSKSYGALRPLRIERLALAQAERVALVGLDQPAAEVLTSLLTGATLPDTGEIRVFDRPTHAIDQAEDWLQSLDRFGVVTHRAPLLAGLTAIQNLALPFSLEIEPPSEQVRQQATALARDVRLPAAAWNARVGDLDAASQPRIRLARALALNPALVLLEHPGAAVDARDRLALARDIRAFLVERQVAAVVITADRQLAATVAPRVLVLDPATGRLWQIR